MVHTLTSSPITAGAASILILFIYLRISSNRCVAPVTLFDWILNVALGSTVAGIVNGTSLVRGLIAIATLMAFQLLTWVTHTHTEASSHSRSQLSSRCGISLEQMLNSPPLVIAFRGQALKKVMRHHRISTSDLNSALRKSGIWHISEVECVIIEPTGDFAVYKRGTKPEGLEPEVLLDVPGYKRLVEHFQERSEEDHKNKSHGRAPATHEVEDANQIAQESA